MVKYWDPLVVVDAVAKEITQQKLEYIEAEHMEILAAAFENAPNLSEDVENWKSILIENGLQGYICLAMCDPLCCELAVRLLRTVISGPKELCEAILTSE